ncbi:uncharacterized protein EV154DRAFT_512778 [Mucor mucedo]|uniref:uncharacterized protein n=1 Tax=Mucor mucedo TaxID=29922 RepID=UPI002220958A|nr:uncharacterized protein EV154DRAFT_512778 [Mucor mucedo]KAI7890053.1 hypothetical protein EV154DRAFT_512778 [Mucor mucedo]
MNYSEEEKLVSLYFKYTKKPTFDQFSKRKKDDIVNHSSKMLASNAITLMRYWVNIYNRVAAQQRSTIKIVNAPKTASVIFNEIFEIYSALRKANHQYTVTSVATLGNYASSAQSNLSDFVHQGDKNESDGEEKEEEKKGDGEKEGGEQEEGDEEGEKEEDRDDGEDNGKGKESINMLDYDKAFNFYTSILTTHAQQRLLKNKIFPVVIIPLSNYPTLPFILLNEAASLVSQKDLDVNETELLKLCLSQTVNLLDPDHVNLYARFIPAPFYDEILQACDEMKSRQPSFNVSAIDEIFGELLQFQFDKDDCNLLGHLDEKKYKEKNKKSEHYKLLRIVQEVVHNFKKWKIEDAKHNNYAEMTYQRKFADILDILLEDEDITVYDGERVSKDTQRIQTLNEIEDNGRKIDLLTKTNYDDVAIELCSIEFKSQDANDSTFKKQQSKNIRTNISILNNISNIRKQSSDTLYMDWRGREGYMVHVFQFKDVMVSYFVKDLYIPKNIMELNDFRSTLQYLCFWRDSLVKLSNEIKLAVYKEKRKYIVSGISAPFRPIDSPPRSPAHKSHITPFFTPTSKRTRKVMEQEDA